MMIEDAKTKREGMKEQTKKELAALTLMETKRVNDAKILQLEAQAVALMEGVDDADAAHELAVLQAQIGAAKNVDDTITKHLELILKEQENASKQGNGGGVGGAPGQPGAGPLPQAAPPISNGSMGGGPGF
jgi:hypothetical protein